MSSLLSELSNGNDGGADHKSIEHQVLNVAADVGSALSYVNREAS